MTLNGFGFMIAMIGFVLSVGLLFGVMFSFIFKTEENEE